MGVKTRNRIKEILAEKRLTAYWLAQKTGRGKNTITRVIKGERGASDNLKADISAALELPAYQVFFISDESTATPQQN